MLLGASDVVFFALGALELVSRLQNFFFFVIDVMDKYVGVLVRDALNSLVY
jgi:hypothetical protein